MKVLVLGERFPPEALAGLDVVHEPADDVAAILTTPRAPVGAELIARLPALRIVATASVGFDHVDLEAAHARGIVVRSVPDYCTEEVADHTLAFLFALLRGVVALDRAVAAGDWNPQGAGPLRTLGGLRVGIVGRLQRPPDGPHMLPALDAAQEYRIWRRLVGQAGRGAEHHSAVGDQHLVA